MKHIVYDLLSNTTAHGFSKIVNQTHTERRVVWLLLTLTSLLIFVAHSQTLVTQLFSEPITTVTNTFSRSFIQPDILVCSKKLFASDFLLSPPRPEEAFMHEVANEIRTLDSVVKAKGIPDATLFLWNNINISRLHRAFSPRLHELIFLSVCNHQSRYPIKLNWSYEMNWKHMVCVRITRQHCQLGSLNSQLTLYFYVHSVKDDTIPRPTQIKLSLNYQTIFMYQFGNPLDFDMADGIVLYFLPPNETVVASSTKEKLQGGFETEIALRSTVYKRKSTKESQCVEKPPSFTLYNMLAPDIASAKKLAFSDIETCIQVLMQREFYKRFHCVLVTLPVPADIPLPLSKCFDIHHPNIRRFFLDFSSFYAQPNFTRDIRDKCLRISLPCTSYLFENKQNQLNWPIYEVMSSLVLPRLKEMVNYLSDLPFPGLVEAGRALSRPDANFQMWRDNFYKVNIVPGEFMSTTLTESLSYTYKNFFSDVGGILGFYIGVSLLTICELLDLVVRHLHIKILWLRLRQRFSQQKQQNFSVDQFPLKSSMNISHR